MCKHRGHVCQNRQKPLRCRMKRERAGERAGEGESDNIDSNIKLEHRTKLQNGMNEPKLSIGHCVTVEKAEPSNSLADDDQRQTHCIGRHTVLFN